MEFGEWSKRERLKRGWDLLTLQGKSGVDNSSIVRIEKAQTQASLLSAIRIWAAFDIPFATLQSDLGIQSTLEVLPSPATFETQLCLTSDDVLGFLKLGLSNEQEARNFTLKWLGIIADIPHLPEVSSTLGKLSNEDFWNTEFIFPYPKHLDFKKSHLFFENGEALTFADAGFYMYLLRQRDKIKKVGLEKALKISDPVLERVERGAIAKLKLQDIVQINNYLDADGLLFAFYWTVGIQMVKIKDSIAAHANRREAMRLWAAEQATYNLTTVYRWIRENESVSLELINEIRSISSQGRHS